MRRCWERRLYGGRDRDVMVNSVKVYSEFPWTEQPRARRRKVDSCRYYSLLTVEEFIDI